MSGPSGTDPRPRSDCRVADISANIEYSVQRIYRAKLPKMQALSGYERKVLLVWCDYVLPKREEVSSALVRHYPPEGDLDGVFFVEYGWKQYRWQQTSISCCRIRDIQRS